MRFVGRISLIVAFSVCCLLADGLGTSQVQAEGLIWNLPADGTWVRYEGTYKQTNFRGEAEGGNVESDWIRHTTIKSVGQEMAEFRGEMQPCRWVEIKTVTGKPSEDGIDAGPVGTVIYKALIPESAVAEEGVDAKGIKVDFLPAVKGFRKVGQGEVEVIDSPTLQVYPLSSLLRSFQIWAPDSAGAGQIDTRLGGVSATQYHGEHVAETAITRVRTEAEVWRAADIPFGLAKWTVKIVRESKDSEASREEFAPQAESRVEMAVQETGNSAVSELQVP